MMFVAVEAQFRIMFLCPESLGQVPHPCRYGCLAGAAGRGRFLNGFPAFLQKRSLACCFALLLLPVAKPLDRLRCGSVGTGGCLK